MRSEKRRLLRGLVGFLALILAAGARAEDATYYVPFVKILSAVTPGDAGPSYVYWASTLAAFNNSALPAKVSINIPYSYFPELDIPPFSGAEFVTVDAGCWVDACGTIGPGFLAVNANSSVVVGADVQRIVYVAGCGGCTYPSEGNSACPNIVSQGSTPLPVYKSFIPANTTAVAGPIDLGAQDHPYTCITGPLILRRRVNVTLYNGGDVEAVFTVIGKSPRRRNDRLFEIPVAVRPRETKQLNAIPLPIDQYRDYLQLTSGYDIRIWMTITSTQPFLAYVTTIFEGGEPGTNAVTVYEVKSTP